MLTTYSGTVQSRFWGVLHSVKSAANPGYYELVLICLTASHRNASFTLLEKLSFGAPSVASGLVANSDFIQGAVLLATCNRFEAYLDVADPLTAGCALAAHEVIAAVSAASGVEAAEVTEAVTVLLGDGVAEHLFSVSSG